MDNLEKQWEFVLNHSDENVRRIAARAFDEPQLRCLYPYPSMSNLRFSRTSQYPYDPLPYVLTTPTAGCYEARDADNRPLAEGDLDVVILAVIQAISRSK